MRFVPNYMLIRKRVLNRNFQLYLSAFSLERRNNFSEVGKEDGTFPIGKLDVQTFPTGKNRDSCLERRNVFQQDMETFPSFPAGREKKTFPTFPTWLTIFAYLLVQHSA